MNYKRAAFVLGLFALTACGGGTQAPGMLPGSNQGLSGTTGSSSMGGDSVSRGKPKYATVHFFIKVPPRTAARHPLGGMHGNFISPSAKSITITLVTVNGNPPPAGLPTAVTTNLNNCSSGCTITFNAPPGSDAFTFAIFDNTNGTGNQIESASSTASIAAGTANSPKVTMLGIPHTFVLVGSMPSGTGGTAFTGGLGQSLAVNVEDADGNVISGTYAQPVTVKDADVLSLTLASALALTGGSGGTNSCSAAASSVVLNSSTDAANLDLCYGGLDIVPAVISGTTSIVTTPVTIGTFAPTIQPIVYTGPVNGSNNPEIDLYVANGPSGGTGSFGTWTASQLGWSSAGYAMAITETDNCNSGGNAISTFASGGSPAGTSWQANAVASPAVGSCTMTMNGGGAQTLGVTVTYTTTGIGVNLHHGKYHKPNK